MGTAEFPEAAVDQRDSLARVGQGLYRNFTNRGYTSLDGWRAVRDRP